MRAKQFYSFTIYNNTIYVRHFTAAVSIWNAFYVRSAQNILMESAPLSRNRLNIHENIFNARIDEPINSFVEMHRYIKCKYAWICSKSIIEVIWINGYARLANEIIPLVPATIDDDDRCHSNE